MEPDDQQVESWNQGVRGDEAPRLINADGDVLRTQAGPGTGKTFAMIRRVERLLHPDGVDARGDEVLVVAFNRVIAKQLREEIDERLDQVGIIKRPHISTVHSLCLYVIDEDMRLLLPHEREAMLYDVLNLYPDINEQYSPRAYDAVTQALKDHEAGHEQHQDLWMAVQHWLDRHAASLISDLPSRLLEHIRQGDFGDRRYQYVIVDEFQDLTEAEQQLFFRLKRDGGQFFGLGDSRQSIYRFRGNDREGLQSLDRWANDEGLSVEDLPMRGCQRCTPEVVEAANQLMVLSGEESMLPTREDAGELHVVHWETPDAEAQGMAEKIVSNIRLHPDERHLVMTTRRQFGYMLRDRIRDIDAEIGVDISFEEGLLESWPVREAFIYLTLLADPDAPSWRGWFGYQHTDDGKNYKAPQRNSGAYLNFIEDSNDAITVEKVQRLAEEERTARRGQGGTNLWDRAQRLVSLSQNLGNREERSAEAYLGEILNSNNWIIEEADDEERATQDLQLLKDKSLEIIAELASDGVHDPDEQMKQLVSRLRHMVATREPFLADESADLQITTLWGAKGVTAEHVYVLGLCDEAIPGGRREEYPGTYAEYIEEQRRLFYVSITRTKHTLILSRPRRVQSSEALTLGLNVNPTWWQVDLNYSRFLREIRQFLPEAEDGSEWVWPAD